MCSKASLVFSCDSTANRSYKTYVNVVAVREIELEE